MRQGLCGLLIVPLLFLACKRGGDAGDILFQAWQQSIEIRAYPCSFSREPENRQIKLAGLAGEYLSAQVLVKDSVAIKGLSGILSSFSGPSGATIPADSCRVRYGAFLPVDETRLMTADPLLEVDSVDVAANEAQPLWLTLHLPVSAAPGTYSGKMSVSAISGGSTEFVVEVEVLPAVLPEPWEWTYYLNIWQDPSGVAKAHGVAEWSPEHWTLLEKYARNFAAHGMDVITASIVYDPWESQTGYPFAAMVEWKFPGEYQVGEAGNFEWDF